MGALPNGHEHGLYMGVILTILTCWDDPPGSGGRVGRSFGEEGGRWLMMMMMMMMMMN